MTVSDVIRRRSETLAVSRRKNITVQDGFQVEGPPVLFNIQGHIQQAQSKDMENAPEGQRWQDWRVLWTETFMNVADRVTESGVTYVIQSIEFWKQGSFYKAMMTEVEDDLSFNIFPAVFTQDFSPDFF